MKQFAEVAWRMALLALVLSGAAYFLCPRNLAADSRLGGKLARVGVQFDCWGLVLPTANEWQGQCVWTNDPSFLARVESWLHTLKRPLSENALRQRGNRIMLAFQDGRQAEIVFLGPDRPVPSAARCFGFSWDGHGMLYVEEPFSEFLRDWP